MEAIKKYTSTSIILSLGLISVLSITFYNSLQAQQNKKDAGKGDYQKVTWDDLIPEGYNLDAVANKYLNIIANLSDNSEEAAKIYLKIQDELNKAPVNKKINEKKIMIPGYIAPLEIMGDNITEFLLVPYFGQCIHTPPPPLNQTVHVSLKKGNPIPTRLAIRAFWIRGIIKTTKTETDIGNAGYVIENAEFKLYEE